jgi:hypothetical protein
MSATGNRESQRPAGMKREILSGLNLKSGTDPDISEPPHRWRQTLPKRIRYFQFSSLFNFVRNNIDPEHGHPCDRPMIRKLFREREPLRWKIIEKETIDEIIFRTTKVRNRLILELKARGNMRFGDR